MTDATRLTKLPFTTFKEIATETSATPVAQQKTIQTGIASTTDSFQVKPESSLFTANPNTGEVRFGDGVSGKRLPSGNSSALLQQSKSEISSYLKGDGKTDFRGMKEYLINTQNRKIDEQMKEAGGSAIHNLKNVASEAKRDLAHNPAFEDRFKHFTSSLNDFEVATQSESKVLQKKANIAEIETSKQEQKAQKADEQAKASNGHSDKVRDAILKFLDTLHGMDPKI